MDNMAEYILGMCSMGVEAELPVEDHIGYIKEMLKITPPALIDYLTAAYNNSKVPYLVSSGIKPPEGFGTVERAEAARLILALQPAGKITDPAGHYRILKELFKDTPEGLMYYLEDGAGTMM